MDHDLFISYATEDKAVADALCHGLEAEGIRCWMAPRDILPGQSWKGTIASAIRHCRVMVLIFSRHSNRSQNSQNEVELAFDNGKIIIPFRIEAVEPTDALEYCIRRTHWLDALTEPRQQAIQHLASLVLRTIPPPSAPAPTSDPVPEPLSPSAPVPPTPAPGDTNGTATTPPIPAPFRGVPPPDKPADPPADPKPAQNPLSSLVRKYRTPLVILGGVGLLALALLALPDDPRTDPFGEMNTLELDASTAESTTQEQKPLAFVPIPAGRFIMGSTSAEASNDEQPLHEVEISQSFEIGQYEVTQHQWEAVMGHNPSRFTGENRPVEMVSWEDVVAFLGTLNQREDGYTYRLPTEAEWEYACRAGTTEDRYGDLEAVAWYAQNAGQETHPVGEKQANPWGLYDCLGNVREWVADWYSSSTYHESPSVDPTGPATGYSRVLRGGSWSFDPSFVRAAYRSLNEPSVRDGDIGVRVVRTSR
jgi:formylglycine-generating enzyme required for sulfatase activity